MAVLLIPLLRKQLFLLMFLIVNRVMKNLTFLSCFPELKLNNFALRSSELKKLLLDLDSFGAVDPNDIFPWFFL